MEKKKGCQLQQHGLIVFFPFFSVWFNTFFTAASLRPGWCPHHKCSEGFYQLETIGFPIHFVPGQVAKYIYAKDWNADDADWAGYRGSMLLKQHIADIIRGNPRNTLLNDSGPVQLKQHITDIIRVIRVIPAWMTQSGRRVPILRTFEEHPDDYRGEAKICSEHLCCIMNQKM